jgi:hypothetical protein
MPNHHRLSNQEGLTLCRILFSQTAYSHNFKVMVITYASEFNTGNCGTQSKYSICKASVCDGWWTMDNYLVQILPENM